MSYMECVRALDEIESDIRDLSPDDRYNRMRLAEVHGLIMWSKDIDREQLSELCDRFDRLAWNVGTSMSRISNQFYYSDWVI